MIVRPKAKWAGLICRTYHYYRRQRLHGQIEGDQPGVISNKHNMITQRQNVHLKNQQPKYST